VLVSSFVIACVIGMTFIPAWNFFFSHRRFCKSERSQTLVCGDWKKTYFYLLSEFLQFAVMAWHEGCRKDFSSCVIKLLFQAAKEVYRPT
jgi:hypothetical protein